SRRSRVGIEGQSRAGRSGDRRLRRPRRDLVLDVARIARVVVRRELQQDRVQLPTLLGFQRGEELLLDLARDRAEPRELLLAGGLEADEMPSAVGGVAAALDQAGFLELVEQADEPAAVVPEGV